MEPNTAGQSGRRLKQIWSLSQRKIVLFFAVMLFVFLVIEQYRKPVRVGDPPRTSLALEPGIANRLDPNNADASALSAIPTLGEKKAREIVEYREAFSRGNPGEIPFQKPDDLMRLKGFGQATVKNLEPYLIFPG